MNQIPRFVIDGMEQVRRWGCINMFNREAVVFGLIRAGYFQAAEWLEANPDLFLEALVEMGKRVDLLNG